LRERLDFAARNRTLAVILAERLPMRPRLIDLGDGTGSLFRFMAPVIARPSHSADLAVRLAFRRDQRREKRLGLALGVVAIQVAEELLAALGFETISATSDWRIARGERSLGRLFARMTAQAASHANSDRQSRGIVQSTARSGSPGAACHPHRPLRHPRLSPRSPRDRRDADHY
jgi:hypothetical protein